VFRELAFEVLLEVERNRSDPLFSETLSEASKLLLFGAQPKAKSPGFFRHVGASPVLFYVRGAGCALPLDASGALLKVSPLMALGSLPKRIEPMRNPA
jgi:hypothetical protein